MMPRKSGWLGNRGRNILAGTIFVAKFINWGSTTTKKAFIREAKMLHAASGTSKHIVNIIGIVVKPPVIIMKYHRNGSLDRALLEDFNSFEGSEAGEFPITRRLEFIHQLCCAVNELHSIGIVHRDIASRNLLLSDDRKSVVLADFGLARKVNINDSWNENVTATAVIPRTSPPEAWFFSPDRLRMFGLKTDVWSLGITMFEIINMRPITTKFNELKIVKGTKAVIPKKLLLEDITIGKSFTRLNEL